VTPVGEEPDVLIAGGSLVALSALLGR